MGVRAGVSRNGLHSTCGRAGERGLQRSLRIRLRAFLTQSRRINQLNDDTELLEKFSPMLQGQIALAAHHEWLGQIW